jgi:hypothetical protein
MKRAHARPALASLGSARYWPAFNLFRHKLKPDLVCAVPEDYPVPGFIDGTTWAFAGKISEPTTIPLGFESKAAEAGVRFNGFYLFQASPIERDTITVERKSKEPWEACAPPWMPNLDPLFDIAEPKGLDEPNPEQDCSLSNALA